MAIHERVIKNYENKYWDNLSLRFSVTFMIHVGPKNYKLCNYINIGEDATATHLKKTGSARDMTLDVEERYLVWCVDNWVPFV